MPTKKDKPEPSAAPDDSTDLDPQDATEDQEDAIALALIKFRGKTFTIPKDMDEWETEACLALTRGEYFLAAKLLLGPSQWAVLQSVGSKRKDTREFLVAMGNVIDKEVNA